MKTNERKIYEKIYYQTHKEQRKEKNKINNDKNKEKRNLRSVKWNKEHPDRARESTLKYLRSDKRHEYIIKYYNEKRNEINKKRRERRLKNKDIIREKERNEIKSNPILRLKRNLRRSINNYLKNKNNKHTFDIIGLSPEEIRKYIESKFTEGMSWENYGNRKDENGNTIHGWDIDHIIPLSSAKTEEEMIKLCHYTNLQPLWHIDNLKKGNNDKKSL